MESKESKEEAEMESIHRKKAKIKKRSNGKRKVGHEKAVKEETEKVEASGSADEVVVNINQQESQANEIKERAFV